MRLKAFFTLIVMMLACASLLTTLAGCNSQPAEEPEAAEPGDAVSEVREQAVQPLLDEWNELAKNPVENINAERPAEILYELTMIAPDGYQPIFDIFADPATEPAVKVLAMYSLKGVVGIDTKGEQIIPQLKTLLSQDLDATTEACALQLLALSTKDELAPVFKARLDAEDSRVRLAALSGLVRLGEPEGRLAMEKMYGEESTRPEERERILFELMRVPTAADLPFLTKVAQDPTISTDNRSKILTAIGQVGNPEVYPALRAIAANQAFPEAVRDQAVNAEEAIKSRFEAAGADLAAQEDAEPAAAADEPAEETAAEPVDEAPAEEAATPQE